MNTSLLLALLLLILVPYFVANAKLHRFDKSTENDDLTFGTDFIFGFANAYWSSNHSITMYVLVSNQNAAPAKITITSPFEAFSGIEAVVPTNDVTKIMIGPTSIQIQYNSTGGADVLVPENKGIYLRSNVSVMVYAHAESSDGYVADTFLVFPILVLGVKYRAATCAVTDGAYNQIAVIALLDNTQVQIGNKRIAINAQQTASLLSASILSGTLITANKPISVVTGCAHGKNAVTDADYDFETIMLLPPTKWSRQYMGVPFQGLAVNTYLAIADFNSTVITYAGGGYYLNQGEYVQFNTSIGLITANNPFQLIQLGQQVEDGPYYFGGSFFLRVPSVDAMSNQSILLMPTGFVAYSNNPAHYMLRIYTSLDFIGQIALDGLAITALLYQRIGQTNYYYHETMMTNSTHRIEASQTLADPKFSVIAYTYKSYNGCGFFPTAYVPTIIKTSGGGVSSLGRNTDSNTITNEGRH